MITKLLKHKWFMKQRLLEFRKKMELKHEEMLKLILESAYLTGVELPGFSCAEVSSKEIEFTVIKKNHLEPETDL